MMNATLFQFGIVAPIVFGRGDYNDLTRRRDDGVGGTGAR